MHPDQVAIPHVLNAQGIVVIQGRLAINGHQGQVSQVATGAGGVEKARLISNLTGHRQYGGRKDLRYTLPQKFDILVLVQHSQLHQPCEEIVRTLHTAGRRHGTPNVVGRAVFQDIRVFLRVVAVIGGFHSGRIGQGTAQPFAAILNQLSAALRLFLARDQLFDMGFRMGKKPVTVKLEITAVSEKGPNYRGFMVAGNAFGKTEGRHGAKIDPLQLGIENLPQLADIDFLHQFMASAGEALEQIDNPVAPDRKIQPCLTLV